MGFIDRIRSTLGLDAGAGAVPWASPHSTGEHMSKIVAADIIGRPITGPVSRREAIRLPAVARARGLIVTTIARIPLVIDAGEGDAAPADPPAWITSTAGALTPFHRMLWTVDDLFFYGWSLWAVDRDGAGAIVAAERIPYEHWSFDAAGAIEVNGSPAPADSVILIPGVTEGILVYGEDTLRQSARLSRAADRAAENPAAQVELHQTNDAPMTEEQVNRLIARWAAARRGEHGGVAYTSNAIEVKEHGSSSEHLLIEGRNAAAVDVARHAGIPATMIDATLSGSSLSYSNTAARLSELVTFGLAPLMAAIAARLSQDDVTPTGVTLKFDTETTLSGLADLGAGDDSAPAVIPPAAPRPGSPTGESGPNETV